MGDEGQACRPRWLAPALTWVWLLLVEVSMASGQPAPLRLVGEVKAGQVDVVLSERAAPQRLALGGRVGAWTFMAAIPGEPPCAVFEDFQHQDGRLLFVDARGVRLALDKSSEPSFAGPEGLLLGHTPQQIVDSPRDLLADELFARRGADDPEYAEVAGVFAPIPRLRGDVHAFVGAPETSEKVAFGYGGRSPSFDPALVSPEVEAVRKAGRVWHGLVGGSLPVLRFVYPDARGSYTELAAFAPRRMVNGNPHHQPVWYRVARVEQGVLRHARYVDTYQPVPPQASPEPAGFYADLLQLKAAWDASLAPAMQVELPDARLSELARHSLIRAIMTRADDYPHYGVFDRDYGGPEHDGFPDTFTVETSAMLEWGLSERAGRYIDNYFSRFVRDDGSVLYRGPEIGQFGRMLSVVAQYVEHGGAPELILRVRPRIDALTRVLLRLRQIGLQLPAADPAHGLIAGYSEADSCLEPDPQRYVQPYFSNGLLAARGFAELGRVWARLGEGRGDAELRAWGERLQREGAELARDVARAIERSMLQVAGQRVLPSIAGAREPHDRAVRRDAKDPQFRAYRAYNEMMGSGLLSPELLRGIVDYRAHHHDILLGMPTAYGKPELAGFLASAYGYGLVQADLIREALLLLYAMTAHQYTRGQWVAPETRLMFEPWDAAPYCTPSQLLAPLVLRWLLVFEDPQSESLWLGRGVPRAWLADGKRTRVAQAPTRWGKVGFAIDSHLGRGLIDAELQLPAAGLAAVTRLRLRTPGQRPMQSVTLNGKPWTAFDRASEVVEIPAGTGGGVRIQVRY
jgi:hypothetical protein